MSETDAAAVAAAECVVPPLPPDAVAEILARVPTDVAFLFRCAVVCKLWCRLLTDPLILRRLLPAESGRRRPSILGFFAERLPFSTVLPAGAPAFVPAPGCALGPAHRSLSSFVRDDASVLDRAEPLAAHDGLLLLRVSPRSGDQNVLRLSVCNLLTGRLDVLPPLNTVLLDGKGVRGYTVLSAANHGAAAAPHRPADGYSTFFQVLLIAVHQIDKQLYLHRFSSSAAAGDASRNWSATPTDFFPHDRNWRANPITNWFRQDRNTDWFRQRHGHFSHGCRAAAVCYGAAHWLFECEGILYIHHVSVVDTGRLCTTRILIDVLLYWFNARLCSSIDGRRLWFVYVKGDNLMIWTQPDGDPDYSFGWRLDTAIQVNVEKWCSRVNSVATVCFGEKSGTVFVIYDSDPDSAYLFDLRSGLPSQAKVTSWNESVNHMTAVPYEFKWDMFFMSRLGTRL